LLCCAVSDLVVQFSCGCASGCGGCRTVVAQTERFVRGVAERCVFCCRRNDRMVFFLLVEEADDAVEHVLGQCSEGFDRQDFGLQFVENFVDEAHDFSLERSVLKRLLDQQKRCYWLIQFTGAKRQ
jgi:hypothetical protein